jgi:hypothetical protein
MKGPREVPMKALFCVVVLICAVVCLQAQIQAGVNLPMVSKIQRYVDLADFPDQKMREMIEVRLEFMPGPNRTRSTTLGRWIVGTINTLEVWPTPAGGLEERRVLSWAEKNISTGFSTANSARAARTNSPSQGGDGA